MGKRFGLLLASLASLSGVLWGCRSQETSPPVWEQAKIGELAVIDPPQVDPAMARGQTKFEVLAFELPSENVSQLEEMWRPLTSKGLRFKNHSALRANGFRVAKGRAADRSWVLGKLHQAQAQRVDIIALTLSDNLEDDIRVRPVSAPRSFSFMGADGSRQNATVESGAFCWRVKAKKIDASGLFIQFTAHPFFKVPVAEAIEGLAEVAKSRQIAFLSAAFTTRLMEGDLLILGPEQYYGDQSTLGGLLLENPRGRLFYPVADRGLPTLKPTLTILLFRCVGIR